MVVRLGDLPSQKWDGFPEKAAVKRVDPASQIDVLQALMQHKKKAAIYVGKAIPIVIDSGRANER